jgi:hypothetical protein
MKSSVHLVLRAADLMSLAPPAELGAEEELAISPAIHAPPGRDLTLDPSMIAEVYQYLYKAIAVVRGVQGAITLIGWLRTKLAVASKGSSAVVVQLGDQSYIINNSEDLDRLSSVIRAKLQARGDVST